MQLGTKAVSLDEALGAPPTSQDDAGTTEPGPDVELPASGTVARDLTPAREPTEPSVATGADAGSGLLASVPASPARPKPPALPAAALIAQRSSRVTPKRPLPPPVPRESDVLLGAPLLPERAHDPHYYPGISDEPPPQPRPQPRARPAFPQLDRRLLSDKRVLAGAASLLVLAIGLSSLAPGSDDAALVVDVSPADAHVTLDGQPLTAASGVRKRRGLMHGEHVLAAERSGFTAQRRVFTFDARGGDQRVVLALEETRIEAPPPAASSPPTAAAPQPLVEAALPAPAADPAANSGDDRKSARELARQRRQERLERRQARREARAAARAAALSTAPARAESRADATKSGAKGAPGLLKLNSVPWAEVYIDKRHVGHTPLMGVPLTPGRHVIRLTNPSLGASKTLRVKVAPGETVTQVVKL